MGGKLLQRRHAVQRGAALLDALKRKMYHHAHIALCHRIDIYAIVVVSSFFLFRCVGVGSLFAICTMNVADKGNDEQPKHLLVHVATITMCNALIHDRKTRKRFLQNNTVGPPCL